MELVEGEERGDHGIIFKKVGPELRVVEGGFSNIPSQALAISNKFGLTFFLHSQGFCVARTHELVQASQRLIDSEDEYNAKDNALASIDLPCVQSLALSEDELVIAACTEDKVQFYNIPALAQKGKEISQKDTALLKSLPILDEKSVAKVLTWNLAQKDAFLVLSKGGKLTAGLLTKQDLTEVANEVEAADWSPDGEYLCYVTSDKNLHICKADLSVRSSFKLPREMFSDAVNVGLEAFVDVLKWARFDSILISCVHNGLDDEEDDSRIFVLVSSQGHICQLQDQSKAKIVSFEGFFTSINTSILPADMGPYTLSNYVPPWELLIVTNRRSIDDHIALLGWFREGGKYEVYKFELLDDRFTPRIELQACGNDNCVVGLAVDTTTRSIEIPTPNGDSGEKLRPGPVLFCMTLEGNLSLFSIARTDNKRTDVDIINNILELPEANKVLLSHSLTSTNFGEKAIESEDLDSKRMLSKTPTQEINNQQNQGTITEETNTEQTLMTLATVFGATGGTKLGPLEKKELSTEEIQERTGVSLKQKESPLTAQTTKQMTNEQVEEPLSLKQKEAPLTVQMTKQTEAPLTVQTTKQSSSEQVEEPLSLKQKEAPLTVQMAKQTETPLTVQTTKQTSSEQIEEPFSLKQKEAALTAQITKQKEAPLTAETTKQTSREQLEKPLSLKQKEAPLTVQMKKQTSSEQLQKTAVVEVPSSQKLGPAEKRKDMNKEGSQAGVGVGLKQKEALLPLEQRNKPLVPTEKKVTNAPALSEMESEFIRELEEVKGMAMQIDNLMAVIDGRKQDKGRDAKPFFTKLLVEDIESRTRNLFRQCQSFHDQLKEQGRSINDLGDDSIQVDYGRLYVQSVLEQAFDVRYQELWNKQTLSPDMVALRKRIFQADQSLKLQIAELEEHLHNVELSQWHKKHDAKHSTLSSSRFEDKYFRSLQSLYDTVNTQMMIAQQLADRLTTQLEMLKLPVIPAEEMESFIDISRLKLQDMVLQGQSAGDLSCRTGSCTKLFKSSDFSPIRTTSRGSLQTPEKVMATTGTRASLQDSTRRRRDSVDKLWVDVGAAKTTVKRAAPAKLSDGICFSPNKGMLETDKKQYRYGISHSSSGQNSASDWRSVMTSNTSFNPVQPAECSKQTRKDILERGASARQEDDRKPQYTDLWKVQPMPQVSTQVTASASITNTVSWPSTALASTAHTASLSAASLKETSFPRTSLDKTGTQNVSLTNAEKLQGSANYTSLSSQTTPQFLSEIQSGPFSFSQVTQVGLPRIESTAKNAVQSKAKPAEAEVEVSKVDLSKKTTFPFVGQGKDSTSAYSIFPVPSSIGPQGKAALNVWQSKATVAEQQGGFTKSEDLKVGEPLIQQSTNAPVEMGSHQSAPLAAGMSSTGGNVVYSADRQGQMNNTSKPETDINNQANTNANFADSSNVSSVRYTNKSLPGVLDFREQKVAGPLNTVHSLSPAIAPGSSVRARSDFVSAVTSSTTSSGIEPVHQPFSSSSSVTASFSPSLFQTSNVTSTVSTVPELSTSSGVLPVPTGVPSETSPLFNVSSVSSVKGSSLLDNSVMPTKQHSSPAAGSVSTSFIPSTLQGPPVSEEEDMEEVGNNINDFGSSSFSGFGLGSSSSSIGAQHSNPFGTSNWNQSSPPASLSVPQGQFFKPASFSIPTPQSTPQTTSTLFVNNLTPPAVGPFASASSGFGSLAQPAASFVQLTHTSSSGQQVLGSALGTFGQTRQIGSPFGISSSPSGFGFATGGGFTNAATGGGFASAATSGGFAAVASGGGFAGVAAGGGFASAATGSGFAGFSGSGISGSPNPIPSGFGGFSGGFSGFGGNTNSSLFTQMRK